MKYIITEEQFNKNKDTLMNIVNLSDLQDAGSWSPDALVRKKQGRKIYTYDDGKFVKRDKEPNKRESWNWGYKPKKVYYLTDEESEQVKDIVGTNIK